MARLNKADLEQMGEDYFRSLEPGRLVEVAKNLHELAVEQLENHKLYLSLPHHWFEGGECERLPSIFAFNPFNVSLAERNSMTKSGQMRAKDAFSSSVSASHRSALIQAASGDRVAPLARVNPALESNPSPVPSFSVQTQRRSNANSKPLCRQVLTGSAAFIIEAAF